MDLDTPGPDEGPPRGDGQDIDARLAAIEKHIAHIETLLAGMSQFNSRLDQVHTTLDQALGLLTPNRPADLTTPAPAPTRAHPDDDHVQFRIVAHLSRGEHGARLVSDVSWPDSWSMRLYVSALLRNLARSSLTSPGCRTWCEIWTPDETGEFIDSAYLDPDNDAIDWESDLDDGDAAS